LVVEAAECLTDFTHDTTQLLTVCRRLLAYHPACGPLWWLCARVVGAADAGDAARDARRRLESDRTTARLTSLLPFPHDEPIAVFGWPELAGAALGDRPDLDVIAVRAGDARVAARMRRVHHGVRVVDPTEVVALGPTHLLVEATATSPTTALVPEGLADVLWGLGDIEVWLVAGVGRVLPQRLFDVLEAEVQRQELPFEVLETSRAAKVAGPDALDPPERLSARIDCPVAPELLRL
jgi:hypothetical protein